MYVNYDIKKQKYLSFCFYSALFDKLVYSFLYFVRHDQIVTNSLSFPL